MTATIEHRNVEANGITFHVASVGKEDAPPVLCLHGFPEGWMSWRPVMQALSGEARLYAMDKRGYPGTTAPRDGYDIFTLVDDVKALIEVLGLEKPLLLSHDWGGAIGWVFAHRYPHLISKLVVVNCTHLKTLIRAVFCFEDLQTLRIFWVPFFLLPWIPEHFLATRFGRWLLRLSFTLREGEKGTMDVALVDELVDRFQTAEAVRGPIDYYRAIARTQLVRREREALEEIFRTPIAVPTTVVWGAAERLLSAKVALNSGKDAGRDLEWRPLPRVGHFVSLEAADKLANEVRRVLHADD